VIAGLSPGMNDARILIVDDEETNLRLLRRILEKDGYREIYVASDGSEVADLVTEVEPDLILLDLHMPTPDGFEILKTLAPRIRGPEMQLVLVLTGDDSAEAKRSALSLGARDFLSKPFDAQEALLRIRNLLETRFLYTRLAAQNSELETRVSARTSELRNSQVEILERLARAGEIRDDETGRHTQRVGELSAAIATAIGLTAGTVELIRVAAPLHDVGKIGIPDAILLKPGVLTDEETALMRSHTTIGARILSGGRSEVMKTAERVARSHHERWDGQGYPDRLAGTDIPIEARIVAVADCIDALTHNRPYRPSWPRSVVLEEIERSAGSHFDPDVVEVTLRHCTRSIVSTPPRPWPAGSLQREAMDRLMSPAHALFTR
jgi:putative two-component system response regulator